MGVLRILASVHLLAGELIALGGGPGQVVKVVMVVMVQVLEMGNKGQVREPL